MLVPLIIGISHPRVVSFRYAIARSVSIRAIYFYLGKLRNSIQASPIGLIVSQGWGTGDSQVGSRSRSSFLSPAPLSHRRTKPPNYLAPYCIARGSPRRQRRSLSLEPSRVFKRTKPSREPSQALREPSRATRRWNSRLHS